MTRSIKALLGRRKRWDEFWMRLGRGRLRDRVEQEDREAAARLNLKMLEYERKKKEDGQ